MATLREFFTSNSIFRSVRDRLGPRATGHSRDSMLRLDDTAEPARFALVAPHEQPVFGLDEEKQPFAAGDDLDDAGHRKVSIGKPLTIEESQPD